MKSKILMGLVSVFVLMPTKAYTSYGLMEEDYDARVARAIGGAAVAAPVGGAAAAALDQARLLRIAGAGNQFATVDDALNAAQVLLNGQNNQINIIDGLNGVGTQIIGNLMGNTVSNAVQDLSEQVNGNRNSVISDSINDIKILVGNNLNANANASLQDCVDNLNAVIGVNAVDPNQPMVARAGNIRNKIINDNTINLGRAIEGLKNLTTGNVDTGRSMAEDIVHLKNNVVGGEDPAVPNTPFVSLSAALSFCRDAIGEVPRQPDASINDRVSYVYNTTGNLLNAAIDADPDADDNPPVDIITNVTRILTQEKDYYHYMENRPLDVYAMVRTTFGTLANNKLVPQDFAAIRAAQTIEALRKAAGK